MTQTLGQLYLAELESEVRASRACIERVPESLYAYKPHETSMVMKSLVHIVAEIPKWVAVTITTGEVNFQTWEKHDVLNSAEAVKYFDDNMEMARAALNTVTDEEMRDTMFYLKMGDKVLMSDTKANSIRDDINHLVHHRGQLTVYMRMNGLKVPSIYGPSADDNTF